MIAYALYKKAKREWASDLDHKPTDDELRAYLASWTASRVAGSMTEAETIIGAFASSVIASATPGIRENALRGTFWGDVWPAMAAAGLYTLGLIALVVILRAAGIDVLSIASELKK